MRIFLTWSGDISRAVATALHEWIPLVLQRIEPFLSSEDIRKGARWQQEIASQLDTAKFAIVCLTRDNLSAPWIHFEAGAVSKQLNAGKVTALLIGISAAAVVGPLAQFQHTTASKADMRKLLAEMNLQLGAYALSDDQLSKTFERFWPDMETRLLEANAGQSSTRSPKRSSDEILAEILDISRHNSTNLAMLGSMFEAMVAVLKTNRGSEQGPLFAAARGLPLTPGLGMLSAALAASEASASGNTAKLDEILRRINEYTMHDHDKPKSDE